MNRIAKESRKAGIESREQCEHLLEAHQCELGISCRHLLIAGGVETRCFRMTYNDGRLPDYFCEGCVESGIPPWKMPDENWVALCEHCVKAVMPLMTVLSWEDGKPLKDR
jgi:hypothetical protein